jgi:hypothetical protein
MEGQRQEALTREFRDAQQEIAENIRWAREEEERQLRQLDDSVVGSSHEELRRLRAGLDAKVKRDG